MSPEKQRIAIAKACGAQIVKAGDGLVADGRPFIILTSEGHILSASCPDYLNDLNAMHEAEKTRSDDERKLINIELAKICSGNNPYNHLEARWWANSQIVGDSLNAAINATAAQRAEAFLRTLNLWEDAE